MIRGPQTLGLATAAIPATLLAAELGFRLVGHDFSGLRADWTSHPIYYRYPTQPVGSVFFRRPGPDTWVGNVLSQRFQATLSPSSATSPTRTSSAASSDAASDAP